jgi:hypothetical protein
MACHEILGRTNVCLLCVFLSVSTIEMYQSVMKILWKVIEIYLLLSFLLFCIYVS